MLLRNMLPFPAPASPSILRRTPAAVLMSSSESQGPRSRRANLSANRKERIRLPELRDAHGRPFPISEFLSHPSGVEALLNTRALQSFAPLDANTYRCTLQRMRFLKFEMAPVIDLRMSPTSEDCTVEMLSCRFEGSKTIEQQNQLFSGLKLSPKVLAKRPSHWKPKASGILSDFPFFRAVLGETPIYGEVAATRVCVRGGHCWEHWVLGLSTKRSNRSSNIVKSFISGPGTFMRNHITWETDSSEPFLDVDVDLKVTLEVYTKPFSLLPLSAVEKPGNLLMQGLLDRLVPLLLEQLLKDYHSWVEEQLNLRFPYVSS